MQTPVQPPSRFPLQSLFQAWPAGRLRALQRCLLPVCLILTACSALQPRQDEASPPVKTQLETVAAASRAQYERHRLEDPEFRQYLENKYHIVLKAFPPAQWHFAWLAEAAYFYLPELDLARARIALAEAAEITAGTPPESSLNLNTQYALNPPSNNPNPWTLGAGIDLPLEAASKRGYRIEHAQRLTARNRYELALSAWQARRRLRETLLDSLWSEAHLALAGQQAGIQEQRLTLLEHQLAVGEIARPELLAVRAERDQALARQQTLTRQAREARIRVAGALGLPFEALPQAPLGAELLESHWPGVEILATHRILNRLDLAMAWQDYQAAEAGLRLEATRRFPDLVIHPGYLSETGTQKLNVNFSFALPQNQGPLAEAEARRQQAQALVSQTYYQGLQESAQALTAYQTALTRFASTEQILDTRRQQFEQIRRRVESGAENRLAELDAQSQFLSAETDRLQTQRGVLDALAGIEDAFQTPLPPFGAFTP